MTFKAADMHCDTMSELYNFHPEAQLFENELAIDIKKMQRGGYMLQNFALFIKLGRNLHPFDDCVAMADRFAREIEKNSPYIGQVRTYDDIIENDNSGRISALLSVEEGAVYEGSTDKLRTLYDMGVRMSTLTWNFRNELAAPNTIPEPDGDYRAAAVTDEGLTAKGFELLAEMQRLGVVIDVSHLSDRGFWDIVDATTGPFVASHSNARALCSHPRNLTDEMIRALANRGGVTGINYFGSFLRDGNPDKLSCVADMSRHAAYLKKIGGIECVGLGSDFDGISGELEMTDCSQLPLLSQQLHRDGFSDDEIEAIFCKNVLRVYKEVLK